jgi:hypothetical protein
MSLSAFLVELSESGIGAIRQRDPLPPKDPALPRVLESLYREAGLNCPGNAPDLEAAIWGTHRLHRICQCLALREIDEETLRADLAAAPISDSAAAHFSADLALRHLPALFRVSRQLSREDPLVEILQADAEQWPFSSVGIAISANCDVGVILAHPGLTRAYLDRIISEQAFDRLLPPLQDLARAALGPSPELSPPLAKALSQGTA